MGFLVGNDFIPHLPHLHIHHDALPLLWKTYMTILPECGGNTLMDKNVFDFHECHRSGTVCLYLH